MRNASLLNRFFFSRHYVFPDKVTFGITISNPPVLSASVEYHLVGKVCVKYSVVDLANHWRDFRNS